MNKKVSDNDQKEIKQDDFIIIAELFYLDRKTFWEGNIWTKNKYLLFLFIIIKD